MTKMIDCPVENFSIVEMIGSGGNGDVFQIKSNDGPQKYALKVLRRVQDDIYERFKIEVGFLSKNRIQGVMPLIDAYLPDIIKKNNAWYLMPLAESFKDKILEKDPVSIIDDFIPLVQTIIELHALQVSHRDIKPDNFLYLKNRVHLADFGLVKYPDRTELTPDRRDVGAKFTMAPEMRRIANQADGIPADIYSLAKSLWMSLTKDYLGFDGQYIPRSNVGLFNFINDLYLPPLDDLLERATNNDPNLRPSAGEFKLMLENWIRINEDFIQRNLTEWFEIQNILFPFSTPNSVEWTNPNEIVNILNLIAKRNALNHMFYPTGGGNDLIRAEIAAEEGFIALIVSERIADIIKPKKLKYESFGHDPEWNYFWLECEDIQPTGIVNALSYKGMDEYMIELTPGNYIPPDYWEINEYQGSSLPDTSRIVNRYIKGNFVFFCKSSTYNNIGSTYEAWQNMGEMKFRELMAEYSLATSGKRPISRYFDD